MLCLCFLVELLDVMDIIISFPLRILCLYFAVELQDVMDIIQFTNHSDPQLKGNSAVVVGHFIRAVIGEGNGDWNGWLITNGISK